MQKMWNLKKIYAAFKNPKSNCHYSENFASEITSYQHEARFIDIGINIKIITETQDGKQSRPDL